MITPESMFLSFLEQRQRTPQVFVVNQFVYRAYFADCFFFHSSAVRCPSFFPHAPWNQIFRLHSPGKSIGTLNVYFGYHFFFKSEAEAFSVNVRPGLCSAKAVGSSTPRSHARQGVQAAKDLLKGFPHLLAPEGVDDGVDDGIAHDEDEVHVEVRHEAGAVGVARAADHEDEMQEKGRPAHHKDAQQDGERDGALHAGGRATLLAEVDGDAARVDVRQQEHV